MITIKMQNEKWRIEIDKEEWEFEDITKLKDTIDELLEYKNEFGRIK